MYACVCMYASVYACIHVCMYVYMFVCLYVCILCMYDRHLKLRTEGRRSLVRELGSIQLCNVTSANVATFCTHNYTGIWNKGGEFDNDMIYIYNFIKHDTLLSSDFTCISGSGYFT